METGQRSRYSEQATDWTTEESGFDSRKCKIFLSFPNHPHQLRVSRKLRFSGYLGLYSGGKTAGREGW